MKDWQQAGMISLSSIKIPSIVAAFITTALISLAAGIVLAIHTSMTMTQARAFFQTDISFLLVGISILTFTIAMFFFRGKAWATLMNISLFILVIGVVLAI